MGEGGRTVDGTEGREGIGNRDSSRGRRRREVGSF